MRKRIVVFCMLLVLCSLENKCKELSNAFQLSEQRGRQKPSLSSKEKKNILSVARKVVSSLCNNRGVKMPQLKTTPYLAQKRGVFVTLRKNGDLRGCIGRIVPSKPLYDLIPEMAEAAAFNDPRFSPVKCDELKDIIIEVSILTEPQPVASFKDIEIGKHGIILSQGLNSAVFLPKVPGEFGWNRDQTLTELSKKAELPLNAWQSANTKFQVFESIDFTELSH